MNCSPGWPYVEEYTVQVADWTQALRVSDAISNTSPDAMVGMVHTG